MLKGTNTDQVPDITQLSATALSVEGTAELGRWLEAKRSLVLSGEVDGGYLDLYGSAASDCDGRLSILKPRLKDSSATAYHRCEMQRIPRECGILFLDVHGANPKLIKEWNALYDFGAAGKGAQQIVNERREPLVIAGSADLNHCTSLTTTNCPALRSDPNQFIVSSSAKEPTDD